MLSRLKNKLPSKVSIGIFLLIFFCSLTGRQIFNEILLFCSRNTLQYCIVAMAIAVSILLVKKQGWIMSFLLLAIIGVAHFFFATEELIHIFFFGALGMSLRLDGSRHQRILPYFFLGAAICVWDEIFQSFLPWRVGDIRDVALNLVSFIIGFVAVSTAKKALESTLQDV